MNPRIRWLLVLTVLAIVATLGCRTARPQATSHAPVPETTGGCSHCG